MVEIAEDHRLAPKLFKFGVRDGGGGEDGLQSDHGLIGPADREIHDPHATAPEFIDNRIADNRLNASGDLLTIIRRQEFRPGHRGRHWGLQVRGGIRIRFGTTGASGNCCGSRSRFEHRHGNVCHGILWWHRRLARSLPVVWHQCLLARNYLRRWSIGAIDWRR